MPATAESVFGGKINRVQSLISIYQMNSNLSSFLPRLFFIPSFAGFKQ